MMLWKLLVKIVPTLRSSGRGELHGSMKFHPLIASHRLQCTVVLNETVEKWIGTLPEDKQKRVRHIQNEIALRQAEGKKTPKLETIEIKNYEEMLQMSNNRRNRYYDYIRTTSISKSSQDIKKLIRAEIFSDKLRMGTLGQKLDYNEYGLGKNTLIMKVTPKTMRGWKNQRLYRAMMLNAPSLIYDCGFSDAMTKWEIQDAARQLKHAFSTNRDSRQPFVMHFCNMKSDSYLWQALKLQMKNVDKAPIKIHAGDITDVFAPEKLVYLSPDAEDELTDHNMNDHYVIGTIVDKGTQIPLTLAKAKRLNIRAARLPLSKYIRFFSHKTLTLDQMTNIMLELKRSQDWVRALKYVPSRKIFG